MARGDGKPDGDAENLQRLLQRPGSSSGGPPSRHVPRRIGNILAELLARRGYAQVLNFETYAEAWRQAAGKLAQESTAGILRGGTLEISVRNSAVLQELQFEKKKIVKKLAQLLPDSKIRELKFRVDSLVEPT